jgi:thiamine phosphate synthase YjbQ (UPF0047 family)
MTMILLKNYFVNTTSSIDVISVLHEVNRTLTESGVTEGLATAVVPEPGGALAIIEPLPDIVDRFKEMVSSFMGEGGQTVSRRKEEIDIGPRVAAAMLGKILHVPVAEGRLVLGKREEPVLIDMEKGGRRREFYVQVMGEGPAAGQPARPMPPPRRR